jgi:3-polyprenyl-4-hydroxybenzoate decarboxylase
MKQTHFPFPRIMPKQANEDMTTTELRAKVRQLADEYRMQLMARAKDESIGIVHIHSNNWPRGGLTVAFKKANEFKSGTMVEVAVNTCSSKDMFSRKLGTVGALRKFFDGETIQLPLLNMYQEEDINWAVKQAFTALWEAI